MDAYDLAPSDTQEEVPEALTLSGRMGRNVQAAAAVKPLAARPGPHVPPARQSTPGGVPPPARAYVSPQEQLRRNQIAAAAAVAPKTSNTLLNVLVDALPEDCDLDAITYGEWRSASANACRIFRNHPGPNNEVYYDPHANVVANSNKGPWYPLENTRGAPPPDFRWGKVSIVTGLNSGHGGRSEVHMSPTWHFRNPTGLIADEVRIFESRFVGPDGRNVPRSIRWLLRELFPKHSDGAVDKMAHYVRTHKKFRGRGGGGGSASSSKGGRGVKRLATGWEEEAAALMAKYDIDGNGMLDTCELVALARHMSIKVDEILRDYDLTGDNALQRDEWMNFYATEIANEAPDSPKSPTAHYRQMRHHRVLRDRDDPVRYGGKGGGKSVVNENEMRKRMEFQSMPVRRLDL